MGRYTDRQILKETDHVMGDDKSKIVRQASKLQIQGRVDFAFLILKVRNMGRICMLPFGV